MFWWNLFTLFSFTFHIWMFILFVLIYVCISFAFFSLETSISMDFQNIREQRGTCGWENKYWNRSTFCIFIDSLIYTPFLLLLRLFSWRKGQLIAQYKDLQNWSASLRQVHACGHDWTHLECCLLCIDAARPGINSLLYYSSYIHCLRMYTDADLTRT